MVSGLGLKINPNLRKAFLNGEDLRLPPKQFFLLEALAEHAGEVVTKEDLFDIVWGANYDLYADSALKYHIKELRKIFRIRGMSNLIETVWGVGYLISFDGDECPQTMTSKLTEQ